MRVATPKVFLVLKFFAFLFPCVFAVSVYVPSWSS